VHGKENAVTFRGCGTVVLPLLVAVTLPGTASGRPATDIPVRGTLPALAFVPLSSDADGTCVGAEISDARRTNVGVVNESASELNVTVRAVDTAGMTAGEKLFTLPPWGFTQLPLSNFVSGPLAGGAVLFLSGSGLYIGYMVVNDNSSNDAFFEIASPNQ
jgi:hypothetical protein